MALSDEQVLSILARVAQDYFAVLDPSIYRFFGAQLSDIAHSSYPTRRIHRWVVVRVEDEDSTLDVMDSTRLAMTELNSTASQLMGELMFSLPRLMPAPVWIDGEPLFSQKTRYGYPRFGVEGGNIVESVGCFASDIENAIDRLNSIDPTGSFDSDGQLTIYCASSMFNLLARAVERTRYNCKLLEVPGFIGESSWVLSSGGSPCGMDVCNPDISIEGIGSRIELGAKYVVWIHDPSHVVRVEPGDH